MALRWDEVHEHYIARPRTKAGVEQVVPVFDEARVILAECPRTPAGTVVTNQRGAAFTPRGFSMAIERARDAAGVAKGKHFHDIRGTFATRLMERGFEDREIDEMMGWETGKSARIHRRYISRAAVVRAAIERIRTNSKN